MQLKYIYVESRKSNIEKFIKQGIEDCDEIVAIDAKKTP